MSEVSEPEPFAVRLGRTLVIGTAGGALFAWWNLPLAWMLGAMVATTAASLGGARLYVPGPDALDHGGDHRGAAGCELHP